MSNFFILFQFETEKTTEDIHIPKPMFQFRQGSDINPRKQGNVELMQKYSICFSHNMVPPQCNNLKLTAHFLVFTGLYLNGM